MAEHNKILIVEDNPETSQMLRTFFESEGYQVSAVAWGKDAIEFCRATVPDLIIEDIRLPDIDGYEVVRELRGSMRTRQVPILFLTERKDRKDRIAGLELGAVDYITKPFDMEELHLRVQNALSRAHYTSLVSPVTGLPGERITEERITELLEQDHWAVLCVTVTGIDPFSEMYGFVVGDDALRAVGLILGNVMDEYGDEDGFVGHKGKAEFLLVTREEKAQRISDELSSRLASVFDYFYPIKDVESGHVEARMTVEVGVALASAGPYGGSEAVRDAAFGAREVIVVGPSGTREL